MEEQIQQIALFYWVLFSIYLHYETTERIVKNDFKFSRYFWGLLGVGICFVIYFYLQAFINSDTILYNYLDLIPLLLTTTVLFSFAFLFTLIITVITRNSFNKIKQNRVFWAVFGVSLLVTIGLSPSYPFDLLPIVNMVIQCGLLFPFCIIVNLVLKAVNKNQYIINGVYVNLSGICLLAALFLCILYPDIFFDNSIFIMVAQAFFSFISLKEVWLYIISFWLFIIAIIILSGVVLYPLYLIGGIIEGINTKKLKFNGIVLTASGLLFYFFLLNMPNFFRASASGQFTGCQTNCRNIGAALELYSTDNEGSYPKSLSQLTPKYLNEIPKCQGRFVKKDTYSNTYQYSTRPHSYSFYCRGHNHRAVGADPNYPQYNSYEGLIPRQNPRPR